MADEIAQVCQLEMQGISVVVKGSLEVAKWIYQALQALHEYHGEKQAERNEKKLESVGKSYSETGNKTMHDVMALSQDGLPQVLYAPADVKDDILETLHKSGVRFFIPPDLDPTDGKIPIMLPPQDMAMASAVVKPYLEEKLTDAQKAINEYSEQIAELKEKMVTAPADERKDIRLELDHLEQGKEEMEKAMEGMRSDIETGGKATFFDYLSQGKGTEFERDPDKAVTELENGVEIGRKFTMDDCLQPVRDRVMMPESKLSFYVPDSGVTIEREFKRDDGAKTVYSEYTFKTNEGEIFHYSDKGYTKEEWNEKIMPQIMDKAGLIEKTECRVFETQDRMMAYVKYFDQITPKSEERLRIEQGAEETKGFSSADVMQEAEHTVREAVKGKASAKSDNEELVLTVPQNKMSLKNGKIMIVLDDGTSYSFPRAEKPELKNGEMVFSIKRSDEVIFRDGGNNATIMPARKALDHMNEAHEGLAKIQAMAKGGR